MCGIIGEWDLKKPIDERLFSRMRDTLTHRGPDGEGLYKSKDGQLALGHRRLTIIDLSDAGLQPLCNEDETIWLTYNGEIYNYKEIKSELEKHGHVFKSNTDSEVIIHGFEQWGMEIVNKLKGMFAFGLWDENNRKLYLVRDRFGIKPLYYYSDGKHIIFSSEIKGIIKNPHIHKEIDFSSMCDYLAYRYVPSPKTIWKKVHKVEPAHYLVIDANHSITKTEYWKIPIDNELVNEEEIIEKMDHLLQSSITYHTVSDVPVGSFLSGGYDSSAMVYYLHNINYETRTFAIGFENWGESEHLYAQLVADQYNTIHQTKILGGESLDYVERLTYHYDEPIADISIVPTYLVSQLASQSVKTVVSGEGADELFCGYEWQKKYGADSQKAGSIRNFLGNLTGQTHRDAVKRYSAAMAMGHFTRDVIGEILSDDLKSVIPEDVDWFYRKHYKKELTPVKSFQYLDVKCFMAELVLTKVDRASMAHSLEARVPFLDHELFEYLYRVHESQYFKKGVTKFVLNEILKKTLPDKIMNRPKRGFVGPDSYYQNIHWYKSYLMNGRLVHDKIIKKDRLKEYIQQEDHWRLWKLLVLEFWYDRWG